MTPVTSAPPVPIWRRVLTSRGLWTGVAALLIGFVAWRWIQAVGGPAAVRSEYGMWAAAVLVPLQCFVAITPFPGEAVAFVNATIYGFWWGALFAWLGWLGASLLQYFIVARTRRDLGGDPEELFSRMPAIVRRYGPHHPVFLICARNMPMGGHIVNTAAGVFDVPLWRFIWTGLIGLAPWSLAVSALANGLWNWSW